MTNHPECVSRAFAPTRDRRRTAATLRGAPTSIVRRRSRVGAPPVVVRASRKSASARKDVRTSERHSRKYLRARPTDRSIDRSIDSRDARVWVPGARRWGVPRGVFHHAAHDDAAHDDDAHATHLHHTNHTPRIDRPTHHITSHPIAPIVRILRAAVLRQHKRLSQRSRFPPKSPPTARDRSPPFKRAPPAPAPLVGARTIGGV